MALRAAVLASGAALASGAMAAPGCGCEVSRCCQVFNNSESMPAVFDPDSKEGNAAAAVSSGVVGAGYHPTCSFLNLVPDAFDANGVCSASTADMANTTVCEAIAANPQASDHLQAGRSVLSVFVEPGTCAEPQDDACLASGDGGDYHYVWESFRNDDLWPSWCLGQAPAREPSALAWTTTCTKEGGITFRAKWVNGSDDSNQDICSIDYTGGLDATVSASNWTIGTAGSPRWRCFDVPRGEMGMSGISDRQAHILAYSIGDDPCAPLGANKGASSGSSSVFGLRAPVVHAGAVAMVAGAML